MVEVNMVGGTYFVEKGKVLGKDDPVNQQCIVFDNETKPAKPAKPPVVASAETDKSWAESIRFLLFGGGVEGGLACVNDQGTMPDAGDDDSADDVVLTPDVGDNEGIEVVEDEDGPLASYEDEYLIEGLGEKVQEGGVIEIPPIAFADNVAAGSTISLSIAGVPGYVFEKYGAEGLPALDDETVAELYALDGMFDMTEVAYNPFADQINIGEVVEDPEDEAAHYIKDPRTEIDGIPAYRIPLYLFNFQFADLTGKVNDAALVCDANENPAISPALACSIADDGVVTMNICTVEGLYEEICNDFTKIGSEDASAIPMTFTVVIPPEAYSDEGANFVAGFVPGVNAENFNTEGHTWAGALRIRLVIE